MKDQRSSLAQVIRESVDRKVKGEAHAAGPDERLQKEGIKGEATLKWSGKGSWVLSVYFDPREIEAVEFDGARNATVTGPPHGLTFKLSR